MITNAQTGTRIDEVEAGFYRITTPVSIPELPGGFSFTSYLAVDDEPLLFHAGLRKMFPLTLEAMSKVIAPERLRHIGYSHFEADECGALNLLLEAAPQAQAFASRVSVLTSLNDYADRPGRGLGHGEEFTTGRRRWRWLDTPHTPHGWDCGLVFETTTATLFCGDLFTRGGSGNEPVTENEILTASEQFRKPLDYFAHAAATWRILEELAGLKPRLLATQHGSAYRGDGAGLLRGLAEVLRMGERS
jgi:flavorubredoxin